MQRVSINNTSSGGGCASVEVAGSSNLQHLHVTELAVYSYAGPRLDTQMALEELGGSY